MHKLFVACLAALALSGCAVSQQNTIDMTTLSKEAYAARAGYAIALAAANEIAALPRCGRAPAPCIGQDFIDAMRKVDQIADASTLAAERAVRSLGQNPSTLQAVVAGAVASLSAYQAIVATVKKGS